MTPRRRPSRISSRNFPPSSAPSGPSGCITIHLGSVHYQLKCFYGHVLARGWSIANVQSAPALLASRDYQREGGIFEAKMQQDSGQRFASN